MFAIMFESCQFCLNNATETDLKINYCSRIRGSSTATSYCIILHFKLWIQIFHYLVIKYLVIIYLVIQWNDGNDLASTRPSGSQDPKLTELIHRCFKSQVLSDYWSDK